MNLVPAKSSHVIVTAQLNQKRYKLLRVDFGKDGSLYVSFPYFRHRLGILGVVTIPPNGQITSQKNLEEKGRVTSHLVKYSHHPSGLALFSQTDIVRSEVRRQSVPLDRQEGHIFSVLVQGLESFEEADERRDVGSSPKRTAITFPFLSPPEPAAIKVVGWWYGLSSLAPEGEAQPSVSPAVTALIRDGRQQEGFLLASPYGDAQRVLFITCEPVPRLDSEPEVLCFYGGFDAPEVTTDPKKETSFLAFKYPASDFGNIKERIDTIDLITN
jgi:hypothetical protein